MQRTRRFFLGATLALVFGMTACQQAADPAVERAKLAEAGTGDIVIGAAWPWQAMEGRSLYSQGMDLAVEKLNAQGGVLGRPVRLLRVDDEESVNKGRLVAQQLANDPTVTTVIGHLHSYVSIPAASIYDQAGLVMISPISTSPKLTQQGYENVFRMTFHDRQVGQKMAYLAYQQGYERVAILYMRNTYGRDLANAFEEAASDLDINVVARQSYTPAEDRQATSFTTVLREWQDYEFDAVFLAAAVPEAGSFIVQARREGIDVPILGGDAMDTEVLINVGGAATEGTVVASNFHVDDPRPMVQEFVQYFQEQTGQVPNRGAAAGYDAVRLLAHAMEQAGTTAPEAVAAALRAMDEPFAGVTGAFAFDDNGDLADGGLIAKVVEDQQFQYLQTLTTKPERTDAFAVAER